MRTTQIARDFLNNPNFRRLGALTVSQLYEELGLRDVTKPELRNRLYELRSRAVYIDEDLGNLIVLLTASYFSMGPSKRIDITEQDTDLIAIHGRRAEGVLIVDPSVKHHVTLFRIYTKLLTQNLQDCGMKIGNKVNLHKGMLTPGHRRDAMELLATFNNFRELKTLRLASGK